MSVVEMVTDSRVGMRVQGQLNEAGCALHTSQLFVIVAILLFFSEEIGLQVAVILL